MCAMTMEQELTVAEVAKRLRVSRYTVVNRIEAGLLKARKEGREYRIRASDLEDYIQRTQYRPPGQQEG